MNLFRKLVIFIIIVICLYVIYHLFNHRMALYEMKNTLMKKDNIIEGFNNEIVNTIQKKNTQPVRITSYPFNNLISDFGIKTKEQKQLKQFCIKSSCNTAYDGTDVSIDMIQYVLMRGCRFLDFEIYWAIPTLPNDQKNIGQSTSVPVVSVSNDPTTPSTNCISLYSVLKYIKQNAFNQNISPNFRDPLFIQLRIKYIPQLNKINNQSDLYDSISDIIKDQLSQFLYTNNVNGETNITDIANKIIIVMDTYANRDYVGKSSKLANIIHMESNTDVLTHTTYEDVITEIENSFPIDKNGVVKNMHIMQQVLPMSTVNSIQYLFTDNYDSMSVISRYSAQFTPMLFWVNDNYLKSYELMFNNVGTGIIMLSSAMNYADGQRIEHYIAYP